MTAERLPGAPSPAVPRNGAVDVLKALAIVGTVTIHASTAAYYDGFGSLPWLSAIFWGTISRWAVPGLLPLLRGAAAGPGPGPAPEKTLGAEHPPYPSRHVGLGLRL